jgi:hypothetical protein
MPILAVGPVVVEDGNAANLAERHMAFVRHGIAPHAGIAAIEAAGAAIVRAAVGQEKTVAEIGPINQSLWLVGAPRPKS